MEALDGNAIAGYLFDVFGREMTTEHGACVHCGAVAQIAELRVYSAAPGMVVRCPRCGEVVIVLADIAGAAHVNLDHFRL